MNDRGVPEQASYFAPLGTNFLTRSVPVGDSVLQHLQYALQTLKGSLLIDPDYGLDWPLTMQDPTEGAASELATAIASAARASDARVVGVRVEELNREGGQSITLTLRLECLDPVAGQLEKPYRISVDTRSRRLTMEPAPRTA